MRTNDELRRIYERIYENGEHRFYSRFKGAADTSGTDNVVLGTLDWNGLRVLDAGCGTGDTAAAIAKAGAATVVGIDYAASAIEEARRRHQASNLEFRVHDLTDWQESADAIVSCGTLEHMDKPGDVLAHLSSLVPPGGHVVLTCPYFLNIRGFIWMTLQELLRVPMSRTDLHQISAFDIQAWATSAGMEVLRVRTFDHERANGKAMIADLGKRLTVALGQRGLPIDGVDRFLTWLERVVEERAARGLPPLEGANALYVLRKAGTGATPI